MLSPFQDTKKAFNKDSLYYTIIIGGVMMGVMDLLKSKKNKPKVDIEVPSAPPSEEELPEFPSPAKESRKDAKAAVEKKSEAKRVEELAVRSEKQELHKMEQHEVKKPIFVKIDAYKDMTDEIGLIKTNLKEAEDLVKRVAEFKEDEDKEFNKWQDQLNDIQKKLIFADKILFQ